MKYIIRFPKGVYHKHKYKLKKRISAFGLKWERVPGGEYTDGRWVGERGIAKPDYPDGSGGRAFIFIETEDQDFLNIMNLFCNEVGVVLEDYSDAEVKKGEFPSDEECNRLWKQITDEWKEARSWRNLEKEEELFERMIEYDIVCRRDYVCGCKEWPAGETELCLVHEGDGSGNI